MGPVRRHVLRRRGGLFCPADEELLPLFHSVAPEHLAHQLPQADVRLSLLACHIIDGVHEFPHSALGHGYELILRKSASGLACILLTCVLPPRVLLRPGSALAQAPAALGTEPVPALHLCPAPETEKLPLLKSVPALVAELRCITHFLSAFRTYPAHSHPSIVF